MDKNLSIRDIIGERFVLLDGAMGTQIQRKNLAFNHCPEELNLAEPLEITDIHMGYVAVGTEVVCTNTFQANGYKLQGLDMREIIFKAVQNARNSGAEFVSLDVGPSGRLIEPMGDMSFDEAYELFKAVAMIGEEAGVDLISLETFTSLAEIRLALLAVKENTKLPAFCSLSFDGDRTISGASVPCAMLVLSTLGADALGFNCSLGPDEMLPLVKEAVKWTNLPIIAKPNAGLPNGKTYSPKEFAMSMGEILDAGASIVGGCCGTDPEYIAELKKVMASKTFAKRKAIIPSAVCNESTVVVFEGGVKTVGERINPTGKKLFKAALLNGTYKEYAKGEAVAQKAAGAELLDVNCGLPEVDEKIALPELVKCLQGELPLVIDTSDAVALEKALKYYCGIAVVNSVNGDEESINNILPPVKKYGGYAIALCLDSSGIKSSAKERAMVADRIIARGEREFGISRNRFIVDTLTLSVATAKDNAVDCLDALHAMKEKGIKTALGVSNVSFGLPNRGLINSTFLAMAVREGLTLAIVNPLAEEIKNALDTIKLLLGGDAKDFVKAHSAPEKRPAERAEVSLEYAIVHGIKDRAKVATEALMDGGATSAEVVDSHLVPALDEVGKGYESGKLFLPELIASAETAKVAFEVIKARMGARENNSKGTILLATVKGDIHDIGKNIVKAVLENYGYKVLDLGKDVPCDIIVREALEQDVGLVGLSALMTTTAKSMAKTVAELKSAGYKGKIMVGGAVITEDYAQSIGADYYAKDANASAMIAKKVFNS